jgi:DNA (cytosine-5)-methyltransferase 1
MVQSLIAKGYLRQVGQYIDLVHTYNGKFRRFRWDDIACTVDTRFGDPYLFLHPNEHRPFTVREAARIQGFSDSYVFAGSEVDQFRLIGNAVPPTMANAAAEIVNRILGI